MENCTRKERNDWRKKKNNHTTIKGSIMLKDKNVSCCIKISFTTHTKKHHCWSSSRIDVFLRKRNTITNSTQLFTVKNPYFFCQKTEGLSAFLPLKSIYSSTFTSFREVEQDALATAVNAPIYTKEKVCYICQTEEFRSSKQKHFFGRRGLLHNTYQFLQHLGK